jgi:hypothetical protein
VARSYNYDFTSTLREKCMEYKWYDASQSVNEPQYYANHRILETRKKCGNSPCWVASGGTPPPPPASYSDLFKSTMKKATTCMPRGHSSTRSKVNTTNRPFAASRYRSLSYCMSWNWNIFTGINTFEHAEFKSEKFPLRRLCVFLQTAILSSLISWQIFSLFNDTDEWWHTIMSLKRTNFY